MEADDRRGRPAGRCGTGRPPGAPPSGRLAGIDDPFGFTWRARNKLRRLSARRTARFAYGFARGVRFERPVFVIGVPRSGTTMLFQVLRDHPELGALPHEGHDAWRAFHHPRARGWDSDVVGPGEVRRGEVPFIHAYFYSYFSARRFVEKTPENSLRIPYLTELFPDATFVAIHRDPPDVVSSLVKGWRDPAGRFGSYFVPEDLAIPGYPHRRRWCFALIDGWRRFKAAPIPEIALAQWEQCVRAIVSARQLVDRSRWLEVRLEDLATDPDGCLAAVCRTAGLDEDPAVSRKLRQLLATPVHASSPARPAKWREENPAEIGALLARMAPTAALVGYGVDIDGGPSRLLG